MIRVKVGYISKLNHPIPLMGFVFKKADVTRLYKGHMTGTVYTNFCFPLLMDAPNGFGEEDLWWTTTPLTDGVRTPEDGYTVSEPIAPVSFSNVDDNRKTVCAFHIEG